MLREKVVADICKSNVSFMKNEIGLFGSKVFNLRVMKKILSKEVYQNVFNAVKRQGNIKLEYVDIIAEALRDWAIENKAIRYTYWFLPMTGTVAQKGGETIEKFTGRQLLLKKSFSLEGFRSKYDDRGYAVSIASSFPFIWESSAGNTLCIPSLFFSS